MPDHSKKKAGTQTKTISLETQAKTIIDEIKAADPVLFRDFHRDPVKNRPHGAEFLETFSQRITGGLSALLKEYSGKRILLLTHAGIIRTILIHVLSAPLKSRQSIRFPYAGMLRLSASGGRMQLEYL